ncbi:hypothetical protein [Caballeronia mineralivorans]|uniref:hypothetical protein n=1 Tax=Caballeronia mineralivorans TaxID=2010198 RepID=UPI001364AAFD|nr:hypothetical protein [Caballeronia mineralivorans]
MSVLGQKEVNDSGISATDKELEQNKILEEQVRHDTWAEVLPDLTVAPTSFFLLSA